MKRRSCPINRPFQANQMYGVTKKGTLAKTTKYRNWISENQPLLEQGMDKAERFPVVIKIMLMDGREWSNKADLDNIVKPICDLMVRAQIIPDDQIKYVQNVEVKFMPWHTKKSSVFINISYEEPEEEEKWSISSLLPQGQ